VCLAAALSIAIAGCSPGVLRRGDEPSGPAGAGDALPLPGVEAGSTAELGLEPDGSAAPAADSGALIPDGGVPVADSAPPEPDSAPPEPDSAPPTGCSCPALPQVPGPSTVVGDGTPASCTDGALKNAVSGGGTVSFDCGPADVTIPINAKITFTKPTLVDGGGKVTLDGQDKTQIFVNQSTLTVKGLTFTRGWLAYKWSGAPGGGGAISSTWSHELAVFDCTFTQNRVDLDGYGGAIFQASNGKLTVVRSHFEANETGGGGAIYCLLAAMDVCDSTFKKNRGKNGWLGGGAIHTDGFSGGSGDGSSGGVGRICGSSFEDNEALATGGGVYFYAYPKDKVYVEKSTFLGNTVIANSGGVSMGGALRLGPSPALITDSTFRKNAASMGGAIATEGKQPATIQGCTFGGNSSDIQGGNTTEVGNTYE
jgi:hypothetical protein